MDRKNDKDDGDTEDNEPRVPVLVGESFGGLLALTVLRALGKEKARQYVRYGKDGGRERGKEGGREGRREGGRD